MIIFCRVTEIKFGVHMLVLVILKPVNLVNGIKYMCYTVFISIGDKKHII